MGRKIDFKKPPLYDVLVDEETYKFFSALKNKSTPFHRVIRRLTEDKALLLEEIEMLKSSNLEKIESLKLKDKLIEELKAGQTKLV